MRTLPIMILAGLALCASPVLSPAATVGRPRAAQASTFITRPACVPALSGAVHLTTDCSNSSCPAGSGTWRCIHVCDGAAWQLGPCGTTSTTTTTTTTATTTTATTLP